jgi:hypothetical protein
MSMVYNVLVDMVNEGRLEPSVAELWTRVQGQISSLDHLRTIIGELNNENKIMYNSSNDTVLIV